MAKDLCVLKGNGAYSSRETALPVPYLSL